MRIALISPYATGPLRGNIITVQRIARFLDAAEAVTITLAADRYTLPEMQAQLVDFKPDLIHGFHAHYCGLIVQHLARQLQIPSVITITGSDLHDPQLRTHPTMITGMESADAIVCFHASDADTLTGFFPKLRGRVTVVPQGVEALPVTGKDHFGIAHEAFVLLLPAALRPVKQVEFPIQALSHLAEGDPTLQLVIAGGVIDNDYAAAIRLLLSAFPLARWLGEVPHEQMGDLYSRADLVLNCSRSESMSNSLMEAMALGRAVLASNIPGNRSLVQDGENGWLYDGEADFRRKITEIRGNASLRQTTGARVRHYMQKNFSPWEEAQGYLSLYRKLVIK